MKIFNLFKRKKRSIDFIKNNNLEEWWNNSFNEREKNRIVTESAGLLSESSNRSTARTLYLMAGNVITKFYNQNPDVIIRILNKGAELAEDPVELFEIYSQLIKLHSERENEDGENSEQLIKLCKKQIDISEDVLKILKEQKDSGNKSGYPAHIGYQKLASIKFREGNKEKALNLINKAKRDNWKGNWDQMLSEFKTEQN